MRQSRSKPLRSSIVVCTLGMSLGLVGCRSIELELDPGTLEFTDPRDRVVHRGPKAPLPDDPEGKRLNYTPQKRADTKLGRFIQKTWKQLPDAEFTFDPHLVINGNCRPTSGPEDKR